MLWKILNSNSVLEVNDSDLVLNQNLLTLRLEDKTHIFLVHETLNLIQQNMGNSVQFKKNLKISDYLKVEKQGKIKLNFSITENQHTYPLSLEISPIFPGSDKVNNLQSMEEAEVLSPITGKILKITPSNSHVQENEPIFVIEAMKMENKILAPKSGKLTEVLVKEGENVSSGRLLGKIIP